MSQAFHDLDKKQQILFIDWMEQNNQDQWITDYEIEKEFESYIDECYPDVEIGPYTYTTSEALKSTDPTAYRCMMNDWSSEEFVEIVPTKHTLYIRASDLDALVEEFLESLNDEEV